MMCAPSTKQEASPSPKVPLPTVLPGNVPPSPTGESSQATAPLPSQYDGNFTSTPRPSDDADQSASAHHLLQKTDYQSRKMSDDSDTYFYPQTKIGKLRNAKDKLVSYLRQKYGVILTAAVFAIFFNVIGWMGCYGLLFVSLQEEFGSTATETGWVGSLAFIVNCVCTPFNDVLRRRFTNHAICVLGIVLCSIGLLSTSFMPDLCYLFITFGFLYGLGSGLVFKSCLDLLLGHFPDNCGRVSFLVLTGSTAGNFAWTPLNTALIDSMGWRNTCRISSAVILAVCLVFAFPMSSQPQRKSKATLDLEDGGETPYAKLGSKTKAKDGKDEIKWSPPREKRLLCMPETWLFGFGCLAPFISMGFYNVNLVSYATSLGYTSNQGATVLTIAAASEAGSKMFLAIFVDKLPFRKVHLMTVLSIFSAVVMVSCAFVPSFPILCVVAVGIGFTRATMNALPFPVGMEIFGPSKTSGSNSLILFTGGLGIFISAFLIGGIFDAFGSYNIAIYICAGCFMLTAVLFIFIPLTAKLYKVTRVKVRFDEVTGAAEMVPVVEDEVFWVEEFVTVV